MLLVVTVVTIAERLRNFGLHMDPRHVQLMLSPRHTDTQTYTKTSIHTELLAAEYEYTRNPTRMDGQQHVTYGTEFARKMTVRHKIHEIAQGPIKHAQNAPKKHIISSAF